MSNPPILVAAIFAASIVFPTLGKAQESKPDERVSFRVLCSETRDEVVEAIKVYSEAKKWIYMGANKAKQGEVTMVKVCLPQVGQILWPVGLHLSALLPCGNVGVYQLGGKTQVSMLHPRYMQLLYPHPEVERAAALSTPLLIDMLEAVAK